MRPFTRAVSLLTIVFALAIPAGSAGASAAGAAPVRGHSATSAGHAHLPVTFEVNRGQTNSRVRFLAHGPGYTLFLTRSSIVFSFSKPSGTATPGSRTLSRPPSGQTLQSSLQLLPLGMSRHATLMAQAQMQERVNYFIGNNPKNWHTNIPTYGAVVYRNVYPGIDLRFRGSTAGVEYDWLVQPGANTNLIRMQINGSRARELRIDRTGNLVMQTGLGSFVQSQPHVYQIANGVKHFVAGVFVLCGHNQVSFRFTAYDHSRPLVIDPLVYSTYLGGSSGDDVDQGIAVDSAGNAYVTGWSSSIDYPTTPGSYQPVKKGYEDVVVSKLNTTGTGLVYATFVGGALYDLGGSIVVDAAGSAYVTGQTASTDFPTTAGAPQRAYSGNYDAFAFKLNSTGSTLVYSTYLGSTGQDNGHRITVDSDGNAYIVGVAGWNGFPTTAGVVQPTEDGNSGAFVTKINPAGTSLVFSTYLGTNNSALGIAVDSANNVFVTGSTGPSFPTTPGAFQTSPGGTSGDGFVTKLNSTATAFVYSTYLGGGSGDDGVGIAVDSGGNAYITGNANSSNFPVTPGAFQTSKAGSTDAFVTKMNPTGSGLVYSTFLGGTDLEFAGTIAINGAGNAYVTGSTYSTNFPVTPNAIQSTNASGGTSYDAYVTELNTTGSALVFSTYLGGSNTDSSYDIRLDPSNNIYIAGYTRSTNFPTTPGAFQTTNHSAGTPTAEEEGFVAKIGASAPPLTNSCVGINGALGPSQMPGNVSYSLSASNSPPSAPVAVLSYVDQRSTTTATYGHMIVIVMTKATSVLTDGKGNATIMGTGNVYGAPYNSASPSSGLLESNVSVQIDVKGNYQTVGGGLNSNPPNTFQVRVVGPIPYDSGLLTVPTGSIVIRYC